MVNFEEFKILMLNKFVAYYPHVKLKNDELIITKENIEASIFLYQPFEEYKNKNSFNLIFDKYLNTVKEEFEKCRFKVDYNKVYPFIKSKEFGLEENVEFVRENLFLNLDILYAMDMGDTFRFILKNDTYDFTKLKQSAYDNLNMFSMGLQKLDEDLEIYSVPFPTDYSSSHFLLEKMKKLIERKVGKNYLFAIPSSTTLFVAKYYPKYIEVLRALNNVDPDPHKVASDIYVCRNGKYDYAEKREVLKIIK
jgi:uncharacterized protein YtpQ (UPF0354 family)